VILARGGLDAFQERGQNRPARPGPNRVRPLAILFLATLPLVTPRLRASDEIEYFAYLRSAVFDRDLEFGNEYQHFYEQNPQGLQGFKRTFLDQRDPATGRHINFGPLGTALLWSPLYLAAHGLVLAARAFGAEVAADGYSAPYIAAVSYGSALYGFLGLLLVHDALRRHGAFQAPTPTLAVAGVWLATPVLYYMTLAPGFSHAASLCAVSLLLWLWLRVRARGEGTIAEWALLGAAGGLAALVREQDLLFLAAPALDLVWRQLRPLRLGPLAARLLALGAAAFLAFLPQLLAYKVMYGRFGPTSIVTSKLDYSSPYFFAVLFDAGHGLFFWSPLLLVASLGLALAVRRQRDGVALLLGTSLLLQVWICGSFQTWTQAGAFGSRRFISATLPFAWGLASVLAALLPRLSRRALVVGLTGFVWWNLSLMVQFGLRLMDRQRLEWPRVAVNQFVEVPPRLLHVAKLFLVDRERLLRERP
jgi:hypothetical protein